MQQSESHPYQTRSMTAASRGTETDNRGGAASSSGSGTHLAADVHLAVYTTPDKTCLTVADWANIPPNVCQQILSIDSEVYRLGGQVYTEWNQVQRSDICRVVSMDLSSNHWKLEEYLDHTDGYTVFEAYTVLQRHASQELQQPETPVSALQMVNQYANLTDLYLDSAPFDWDEGLNFSAIHLVNLHLDYCMYACCAHIDFDVNNQPEYSFSFLNKQQMLQNLWVSIGTDYRSDAYGKLVVTGDLHLPSLMTLYYRQDDPFGEAILHDLTLKYIPRQCCIDITEFELQQELAQGRVLWSKLMQAFCFSSVTCKQIIALKPVLPSQARHCTSAQTAQVMEWMSTL